MIRKIIKQDGSLDGNYPEELKEILYSNAYFPEEEGTYIRVSAEQNDYINENLHRLRYDASQEGIWADPKGVVDISDTVEFKAKQNEYLKSSLLLEIDDLDKKRIRALAEPATRDDGQSWLEYYNFLIQEKRQQITNIDSLS